MALASHKGTDDAHTGRASNVGHDVMSQVHLHQCLLHVLDMRGRIVQQPFALAQIVT